MKVKMLVGLSGPTITLSPGDEHDFPSEEALRFIQAGFAAAVDAPKKETAVKKAVKETRRAE